MEVVNEDNFESVPFDEICRICISSSSCIDIFSEIPATLSNSPTTTKSKIHFNELIEILANELKINKTDDLPKGLCKQCAEKLANILEFKIQMVNSFLELTKISLKEEIQQIQSQKDDEEEEDDNDDDDDEINDDYDIDSITLNATKDTEFKLEVTTKNDEEDQSKVKALPEQNIKIEIDETKELLFFDDAKTKKDNKKNAPKLVDNAAPKKSLPQHELKKWEERLKSWIKKQQNQEQANPSPDLKQRPFTCEICGKSYTTLACLQDHAYIHTGILNYHCKFCDRRFGNQKSLSSHIRVRHTNVQMHKCEICGYEFNKKSNLTSHMWIHSDKKRFTCNICQKSFKWQNGYTIHMNSHLGNKSYKCYVCEKSGIEKMFVSVSSRNKHCNNVHGGKGKKPVGLDPMFRFASDAIIKQTIYGSDEIKNSNDENIAEEYLFLDTELLQDSNIKLEY